MFLLFINKKKLVGNFQYPAVTPKQENTNKASSKFFNRKKNNNKPSSATLGASPVNEKNTNSSGKNSRSGSPAPGTNNNNNNNNNKSNYSSRSITPKGSPRSDGKRGKNRSFTNINMSTTQPSLSPDIPPAPQPIAITSNDKLTAMSAAELRSRIKYLEQQVKGVESKYQATINVMQMKLHDARKKNSDLQGTIQDLRKENGNLRKSKIDLMTWANTEITALKKKNTKYKSKLEALQNGSAEGTATS